MWAISEEDSPAKVSFQITAPSGDILTTTPWKESLGYYYPAKTVLNSWPTENVWNDKCFFFFEVAEF